MRRPEEKLQRQVVTWLQWVKPACLWWHCPNGGARSKAEAGIFKAMGVKAGVADLCFVLDGGKAAFIELKADKRKLSDSQELFAAEVTGRGAYHATARSIEDVDGILRAWGAM